ncbi:MAG: DUF1349 domain-containing protein [Alphaproteobacteria bacterium]|nr:DUF1349 domain-containing protein [Alphaproteobacteria bacterium]
MILENLKNFEWLNEPENVIFADKEMKIVSKKQTDFWQSKHHNFSRDNGHLFFFRFENDFSVVIHWKSENTANFNQCGLMVRLDDKNWFKTSLMYQNVENPEIGSCVTMRGHSDWAGVVFDVVPKEVWYKLVRKSDDFIAYYSLDGKRYIRLRQFYMDTIGAQLKVGAYICSPQNQNFEAILQDIDFIK